DRSDDGRCDGELRDARRSQHRGTGRADWICGPARDRADHTAEAAGRISEVGIFAGAWIFGRGGAAEGTESIYRVNARFVDELNANESGNAASENGGRNATAKLTSCLTHELQRGGT